MGINLVQFQPGLSLSEFMDRYGTEAVLPGVVSVALAEGISLPAVRRSRALALSTR